MSAILGGGINIADVSVNSFGTNPRKTPIAIICNSLLAFSGGKALCYATKIFLCKHQSASVKPMNDV